MYIGGSVASVLLFFFPLVYVQDQFLVYVMTAWSIAIGSVYLD